MDPRIDRFRAARRLERDREDLGSELRASFAFVIATIAILMLVSLIGLALS